MNNCSTHYIETYNLDLGSLIGVTGVGKTDHCDGEMKRKGKKKKEKQK